LASNKSDIKSHATFSCRDQGAQHCEVCVFVNDAGQSLPPATTGDHRCRRHVAGKIHVAGFDLFNGIAERMGAYHQCQALRLMVCLATGFTLFTVSHLNTPNPLPVLMLLRASSPTTVMMAPTGINFSVFLCPWYLPPLQGNHTPNLENRGTCPLNSSV
jgi:hypothetical protein